MKTVGDFRPPATGRGTHGPGRRFQVSPMPIPSTFVVADGIPNRFVSGLLMVL